MIRSLLAPVAATAAVSLLIAPALAQSINVGSTGVDGVFNPQSSVVVDLATQGMYDPVTWRVVFNYQSVHIPAGVVVTFTNHPSRAPVVWLAQGDILIEGEISLKGMDGRVPPVYARSEPGPGGFRGGNGGPGGVGDWMHSGGLGPGGARVGYLGGGGWLFGAGGGYSSAGTNGQGNSVGGVPYGDPELTWLVGGSGGAGGQPGPGQSFNSRGGGAGGGALLLASNTLVHVADSGSVLANGGGANWQGGGIHGGGGSGGAIRVVSQQVRLDSTANLQASGGGGASISIGKGAYGRIRLEANVFQINNQTLPPASQGPVGSILPPVGAPSAQILQVGGNPVPQDPRAGLSQGSGIADMNLAAGTDTVVVIQTTNVPLDSQVYLHVTQDAGQHTRHLVTDGVTNPLVVTGGAQLQAQVSITLNLPYRYSALQARVVLP